MLIYKERLPESTLEIVPVRLPFHLVSEAKDSVLKVDSQFGCPCMWYQADVYEDYENIEEEFYIIAVGTGHTWNSKLSRDSYIGTVLLANDTLVLHYFILKDIKNIKDYFI